MYNSTVDTNFKKTLKRFGQTLPGRMFSPQPSMIKAGNNIVTGDKAYV